MPKIGILDQLTDSQQAQLLAWLETMSLTEVLEKLNAAPPEGFGIRTYMTSLRRFQARINREQRAEMLEQQPAAAAAADRMLRAAQDQLLQHVLHLVTTSNSSSAAIGAAAKIIAQQQDYALSVQELELRQRALKLAEDRLQLDRQSTAAQLILNEARIHHNLATDQIKEAAENILHRPNASEPPADLNECNECEGCDKCDPAD